MSRKVKTVGKINACKKIRKACNLDSNDVYSLSNKVKEYNCASLQLLEKTKRASLD